MSLTIPLAHGIGGIRDPVLPDWLMYYAAALTLILSFVALGANYQLTDNLLLRGGVAYDQTPVQDEFRTARLPDEDRFWVALGGTYALTEMISIDVGFTHIFIQDAEIDETLTAPDGAPIGTHSGDNENSVDIFAVQANLRL